eukprot:evm.model.scf_195.10 EVM.evm.TU.scf_195.10   scf_195:60836-66886(-)
MAHVSLSGWTHTRTGTDLPQVRTLPPKFAGDCAPGRGCGQNRLCASGVGIASSPWTDEFSSLDDRRDAEPLPMPSVNSTKRVVLVRHGQSTWNAEGRIQGSSNDAVLTEFGELQAATTGEMLAQEEFDVMFHSPLERAKRTAEIVWNGRSAAAHEMPCLREIDLYSFQGLLKADGKQRYGDEYKCWQRRAQDFEIDSHAPVRELWYRASLAWQHILGHEDDYGTTLVVAHNAVNQALVATAIGFPNSYFRRLLQSNAATTVLDFQPVSDSGQQLRVTLDRLNQSPESPFVAKGSGRPTRSRIVLVRHGGTDSTEAGLLLGAKDEPCSILGKVQAQKTAELLIDVKCDLVLTSPMLRARETATAISEIQALGGHQSPDVLVWDELRDLAGGEWEMQPLTQVRYQERPGDAEPLDAFWTRLESAWEKMRILADAGDEESRTIVVVAHSSVLAGLLGLCLDAGQRSLGVFRHNNAGVSLIEFPDGAASGPGIIRCVNYSAHLGRWAVPLTLKDLDSVCGIDGCF